jgi:hypothetical protein
MATDTAVVGRQGEWYTVMINGQMLGQFAHLLDAHCFALQLMDRDIARSVRLYSGNTVT